MLARQVDGIIWAVPEIGDNHLWLSERVQNLPTPVIFLSIAPREGAYMAEVDNFKGGQIATQHLLEYGNRRIGIITGPMTWLSAQRRAEGWRTALQAAGITDLAGLTVEGNWTAVSGEAALYQLLEQSPDLDAVFVSNDQMALGALQAARRAGRLIPDDLAIVGFDDIPEAAYSFPPLTTVRQDLAQIGQQAVLLLDRILEARRREEDIAPEVIWVTPELVVRESSVPR
jgi:DNA-binding LacI/PurR family transcriptional regulator